MGKKKPAAPAKGRIVMVLDETGSMGVRRGETINSFNEWVANAKLKYPGMPFTLVRFNSEMTHKQYDGVPIEKVSDISDYMPNGMTPLYDAIGEASAGIDKDKEKRVLFVVITDGQENFSKRWSREHVFRMVDERKKAGWEFVFLGVDIDAWEVARHIGIDYAHVYSMSTVRAAYDMTNTAADAYFSGTTGGKKAKK